MTVLLNACAALQILIGTLNLLLPRMLGWRRALSALPPLVRQVFYVHALFLSLTLWIFAYLTVAMGPDLGPLGAGIGVFWAARVVVQIWYYSPSHWRGNTRWTVLHVALLGVYSLLSASYLASA